MADSLVSCASWSDIDWQPWSQRSANIQLAVFRFRLPDEADGFSPVEPLLQPDEVARALRYHRPDDQRRSAFARGLLRLVAGWYLSVPPQQVRLVTGEQGKLTLDHGEGLHLNVSHTGHWIGLVVGSSPVGIDIESIDPGFDFQSVSDYSFGSDEQRQLTVDADPRSLFYQLWTRKEAFVKATGRGVDDDFHRIPALDGDYRISEALAGQIDTWLVRGFWLTDSYPAAVVYQPIQSAPVFYTVDASVFDSVAWLG